MITAKIKIITGAHRRNSQIYVMLLIDKSRNMMIFAKGKKHKDGVGELEVNFSEIWINDNRVKSDL